MFYISKAGKLSQLPGTMIHKVHLTFYLFKLSHLDYGYTCRVSYITTGENIRKLVADSKIVREVLANNL